MPPELSNNHVAYICVFDNREWIPVYYGTIENNKVEFNSMGRNILYIAATLEHGKMKPFGSPFIITADGSIKDINENQHIKQEMRLSRKYPFFGKQDHFNGRMSEEYFKVQIKLIFPKQKIFMFTKVLQMAIGMKCLSI